MGVADLGDLGAGLGEGGEEAIDGVDSGQVGGVEDVFCGLEAKTSTKSL